MKLAKMIIGIGLFAGPASQAAPPNLLGVGAHGGNVVVCDNAPPVTLDYYDAALPTVNGAADIVDLSNFSFDQTIQLIYGRLDGSALQHEFNQAVQKLGPIGSWKVANLQAVDDAEEPYILPANCKRVTAAVRQQNVMYVDLPVYNTLSASQKGLLYVHEILYFISKQNTSAKVRQFLSFFLRTALDSTKTRDVTRLIGPYYWFEVFRAGDTWLSYFQTRPGSWKVAGVDFESAQIAFLIPNGDGEEAIFRFQCSVSTKSCFMPWGGPTWWLTISDSSHAQLTSVRQDGQITESGPLLLTP
jgi:hypothetical protein